MISLYTGTPGSGKSFHVAIDIMRWLKRGRTVITNFDVNTDLVRTKKPFKFILKENYEMSAKFFIDYCNTEHKLNERGYVKEAQTLVVIDECQLIFNARTWNEKGRSDWASFFTQHRKYGYEIILVTQFDRLIDRQLRSLVEYEFQHRKVNNFGFIGGLINLFLLGRPLFVAVQVWYGIKEKCSASYYLGSKRIYEFYNSYKLFSEVKAKA